MSKAYEMFGCKDHDQVMEYRAQKAQPMQQEELTAIKNMSLIEGLSFVDAAVLLGVADDIVSIRDRATHADHKQVQIKDLQLEGDTIYFAGSGVISFKNNFTYTQPLEWLASRAAGCTWAYPTCLAREQNKKAKPFWFA